MAYNKRHDGRKKDELRPMTAKAGVIKNADGSGYFKIGNTAAYAAVYGPRELHPKFLQNPSTGILRCNYNTLPFSGTGDRIRPGQNRRAKEISLVTKNSLLPVLDLTNYPNSVVDVFIEIPEMEAGSRCAGICAAAIALADAGLPMKDMVAAISVGTVDGSVLVDLDYFEEAYEEGAVSDIPVAMLNNSKKVSLLQMDGEISKEHLKEALEMAKGACAKIHEVQVQAIKEKYEAKKK